MAQAEISSQTARVRLADLYPAGIIAFAVSELNFAAFP